MDYFDCHADTLTKISASDNLWENSGDLDLARVRKFADRYAQIFALFKDRAQIADTQTENVFWQLYERAAGLLEQTASAVWCRNAADMRKAHEEGKAAVFLSVEDVSVMGSYVERIEELGIRFAMPAWNYENMYACGAAADQSKGLTADGRALVRRLLDGRAVLDISHLSDQGVEDLFLLTDRPVMASHSNARWICSHARNLKKAHIKELIRRKGLMGINFYREFVGMQGKLTDLIRHMDAVLALGGEDILAIGSDFDGCSEYAEGITGVQSIPELKEALLQEGFGAAVVEKIFFGNAERFLEENLAVETAV